MTDNRTNEQLAERLWSAEKHAERMEAERDAALAVVERVRAAHPVGSTVLNNSICQTCGTPWPCPTVAALDGPPEPEWEEHINYGGLRTDGSIAFEARGKNYATHYQAALTAAGVTPPAPLEGQESPEIERLPGQSSISAPVDREKLIEAAEMHVAESRTTESGESILACGWCEDDWPCITSRLRAALAVSPAPLVLDEAKPRRRLRACVEAWPDCESGDYNPSCCRFPKSCSAGVYDLDRIQDEGLEPVDEDERGGAQ